MGFIERGRVRNGGYGRGGYIPRRGSGSRDGPENTESVFKRYKAKGFIKHDLRLEIKINT